MKNYFGHWSLEIGYCNLIVYYNKKSQKSIGILLPDQIDNSMIIC